MTGTQAATFFAEGILTLVPRHSNCLGLFGDYTEKKIEYMYQRFPFVKERDVGIVFLV